MSMLPDGAFIRFHYFRVNGRLPNLRNPQLFTEKLQWLKLHDYNPLMTTCADKVRVRDYVASTIGDKHLIPLLDVSPTAEDLRFEDYPSRYILKVNHGSGANVVVIDDMMKLNDRVEPFDRDRVIGALRCSLRKNYSKIGRESQYHDIRRMVLVEPLLEDATSYPLLRDYKVHVFNGRAEFVTVISDRGSDMKESWFDRDWRPVDLSFLTRRRNEVQKPAELGQMLQMAEMLAGNFPYVRVDLYLVEGEVMFGEMTFHPASGFMRFFSPEADAIMGSLLSLPDHV